MCPLGRYPFTIICKREVQSPSLEPLRLKKGTQDIVTFLEHTPEVLARILAQVRVSLKDAATVNTTHWVLFHRLRIQGLPIECGTGGRTKFNRVMRGLEEAHWLDAACVGTSTPEHLDIGGVPLLIKACGRGCRQLCLMDKHAFPRTRAEQKQSTHGFRSGDIGKNSCQTLQRADGYGYQLKGRRDFLPIS